MSDDLPDFYNDLTASLDRAWALLSEGARNRSGGAHTPSLATVDADGRPRQRIMVLRACDRDARSLRFHTDARSNKIAEIAEIGTAAPASILVYDPDAKLQLRLTGTARIETESDVAEHAWLHSDNYARRCYLVDPGPGMPVPEPSSGLPEQVQGEKPTDEQLAPARANFAVVQTVIEAIDFYYLAHQGHRRARFAWNGERWDGSWLIP